MKVLDLTKVGKHTINKEIDLICGGKSIETYWIAGFEKGLGGLTFKDGSSEDETEKYLVTLSFLKLGLGIYFRNIYHNYLVLIPNSEISGISIEKAVDNITPFAYSPYSLLKRFGFSDHTAQKYLMPKEIIDEKVAQCIIRVPEKYFKFDLEKISPDKLISIFKKTPLSTFLSINIEKPYVNGSK